MLGQSPYVDPEEERSPADDAEDHLERALADRAIRCRACRWRYLPEQGHTCPAGAHVARPVATQVTGMLGSAAGKRTPTSKEEDRT